MSSLAERSYLSIGQVVNLLRGTYPDLSNSKIRFLEDKGLIKPERTPAGYRKFSDADVARLRYVLRMQRDHYLPLKVIRENLALMDRGLEPPEVGSSAENPPATRAPPHRRAAR